MRCNEILTLERQDVHFSMGKRGALGIRSERSKNKKPRFVPMTPKARNIVDRLLISTESDPTARLLRLSSGQNVRLHALRRRWIEAREKAGLLGLRIHDLRHTFASWLVQRGVSLSVVQGLLGHADISMTTRYSHLEFSHYEEGLGVLWAGEGRER